MTAGASAQRLVKGLLQAAASQAQRDKRGRANDINGAPAIMIGYVTLGTNDFERALAFYDSLFEAVGVKRLWSAGSMAAWGKNREAAALSITTPYNQESATAGNGVMVALRMETRDDVQALHAKALALGGADEGQPGPRGDHGFYGAYFRDLDGNKLNAYVPA